MLLAKGQVLSQEHFASCPIIISYVEKILEQKMSKKNFFVFGAAARPRPGRGGAVTLKKAECFGAAAGPRPQRTFQKNIFLKIEMLLKSFAMQFRRGPFVRSVKNSIFFVIHRLTST